MAYKFRKVLAAACASTIISGAAYADEFTIDRLFVVGDSLSDSGTYSQAVQAGAARNGQTVPNIQYRFLNNAPDGSSQTYAEVVADELGLELQPNLITGVPAAAGTPLANDIQVGGTNFGQGGSRVAIPNDDAAELAGGITQDPASLQIERLLADGRRFDSNDLVIYWVGANDISTNAEAVAAAGEEAARNATLAGSSPAQIQAAVQAAVQQATAEAGQAVGLAATQAVAQIEQLRDAGASNLVVVTVPDIGTSTPVGQESSPEGQALLSGLSTAYNNILVGGVAGTATVVDAGAVLNDVLANPVRYGFSDIDHLQLANTSCLTDSSVQCLEGFTTRPGIKPVFADDRHPSAAAHVVLGQMASGALVAIGQAGVMPVATISALRQQSIGLEQRLNIGAFFINDEDGNRIRRPVGNVEVYGGAELGFFESDQQQVVPGFSANTEVVKAAADVMVTENIMVGVGGSIDHGRVEFVDDRGGFDSRLFIGGVFGVAQVIPGVYVNTFLGGGLIDIYDIDRSFQAGPATESYNADTNGTYFIARTNVGAILPVGGGFAVNPSVGFAYERVDIDGYNESALGGSSPALAAQIGDLEYEGHRGTVALAGFYRPPSDPRWLLGLRGSWEHDFNDDKVKVPFAVAGAPKNTQIAPRPDDSYGLLSFTASHELTHNTALTLQGSTVFEQDGVEGYTASILLKHSF